MIGIDTVMANNQFLKYYVGKTFKRCYEHPFRRNINVHEIIHVVEVHETFDDLFLRVKIYNLNFDSNATPVGLLSQDSLVISISQLNSWNKKLITNSEWRYYKGILICWGVKLD